jgi:hypothetical protein
MSESEMELLVLEFAFIIKPAIHGEGVGLWVR